MIRLKKAHFLAKVLWIRWSVSVKLPSTSCHGLYSSIYTCRIDGESFTRKKEKKKTSREILYFCQFPRLNERKLAGFDCKDELFYLFLPWTCLCWVPWLSFCQLCMCSPVQEGLDDPDLSCQKWSQGADAPQGHPKRAWVYFLAVNCVHSQPRKWNWLGVLDLARASDKSATSLKAGEGESSRMEGKKKRRNNAV